MSKDKRTSYSSGKPVVGAPVLTEIPAVKPTDKSAPELKEVPTQQSTDEGKTDQ